MSQTSLLASLTAFLACLLFRAPLESSMATHVIVLLPALVATGWLAGHALVRLRPALLTLSWNDSGAAGLLVALFAALFWMLPRSLDWSLGSLLGELAKFVILPALVGLPLALSWPRAPLLVRSFVKANGISMALTLGWIYSVAPVRLCNSYGSGEQELLGIGFLGVAAILAIVWAGPVFGLRLATFDEPSGPSDAMAVRS